MRNRAHRPLLAAAGLSLLLASSSCVRLHVWKLNRVVDRGAARFHENFKASRFETIYAEASPNLRAVHSKEEFVNKLRDARARLGDSVDVKESPLFARPEDKEYDWVVSVFEVDGAAADGREIAAWEVSDAEAKLQRYTLSFNEGKESIELTP